MKLTFRTEERVADTSLLQDNIEPARVRTQGSESTHTGEGGIPGVTGGQQVVQMYVMVYWRE